MVALVGLEYDTDGRSAQMLQHGLQATQIGAVRREAHRGAVTHKNDRVSALQQAPPAWRQRCLPGHTDNLAADPPTLEQATRIVEPIEIQRPPAHLGGRRHFSTQSSSQCTHARRLARHRGAVVDDTDHHRVTSRIEYRHDCGCSSSAQLNSAHQRA